METKPNKKPKKLSKKPETAISNSNVELDQPKINIGLIGHVDHGKTTLMEKLTGKWTDTHSEEVKRGITIRLGYANTMIYQCEKSQEYTISKTCEDDVAVPMTKVSFVDAPGHESLMATMLSGAAIMDGALLLIAADEKCPQPQTKEHLMALEILGIDKVIIIQNKIDLLTPEEARQNHNQIKEFIKHTKFKDAPIIPISAKYGININYVLRAIVENVKAPERQLDADPIMFVARSFDINKPGTPINDLKGGVIGGSIKQGQLKVGDDIEILPGFAEDINGKKIRSPLTTTIIEMKTDNTPLNTAVPGGSIAIQTTLDPSIVKSDQLTGNVVGLKGKLPPIREKIRLKTVLFKTIIGNEDEDIPVDEIKHAEMLMLNIYSATSVGVVSSMKKDEVELALKIPVCAAAGARVSLSRRIGSRFRLIGYGIIV